MTVLPRFEALSLALSGKPNDGRDQVDDRPTALVASRRPYAMGAPNAGNCALRQPSCLRHRSSRPSSSSRRAILKSPSNHTIGYLVRHLPRRAWPGFIGEAIQPASDEACAPFAGRLGANAKLLGDHVVAATLGGSKHHTAAQG
jgi:hypothetical protein